MFASMKYLLYLCIVFFIVLDLRLTKVGVRRYSFFYVRKLGLHCSSLLLSIYQSGFSTEL